MLLGERKKEKIGEKETGEVWKEGKIKKKGRREDRVRNRP
jgi:hypothetical protein